MKFIVPPKLRVAVFLFLVNALWLAAAWVWFERSAWLWLAPIALSINFLLLTYDQILTLHQVNGEALLGQDPWGLLKTVHELCDKFEIRPIPQIFLVNNPSAQVFCYAKRSRSTRLFVTEGALKLLHPNELRAVLTYQMFVMRTKISLLNYWLATTLDLLLRVGRAIERAIVFILGWSPKISIWLIRPWCWLLQYTLLSPRDFRKLDAATATKVENPEDLARALWKMEAYANTHPWIESWVFAHMCMVSPLSHQHTLTDIRLQPPLKDRLIRVSGRYPL